MKGPPIHPDCPINRSAHVTIDGGGLDVGRSFVVPRPAAKPDALRITATATCAQASKGHCSVNPAR
ncbi:MAG TPA: hypothetical protein VII98_14110 [Solirubrobacteraceae bacterium]